MMGACGSTASSSPAGADCARPAALLQDQTSLSHLLHPTICCGRQLADVDLSVFPRHSTQPDLRLCFWAGDFFGRIHGCFPQPANLSHASMCPAACPDIHFAQLVSTPAMSWCVPLCPAVAPNSGPSWPATVHGVPIRNSHAGIHLSLFALRSDLAFGLHR